MPCPFGARRRSRKLHLPCPGFVSTVIAYDEICLALLAPLMTRSLALQRNTLKAGSLVGSGLLLFGGVDFDARPPDGSRARLCWRGYTR